MRTALRFLWRCWTGEDLTKTTGAVGIAMFVGVLWFITNLVATAVRAAGFGEPAPTVIGVAATAAYLGVGYIHDTRAARRRAALTLSRARTSMRIRGSSVEWLVSHDGCVVATDVDGLGQRRRLWRYEDPIGGARVVAVEVTNSTPEPDGTRRSYFIRVPPDIRTCQAAVAWTFGLSVAEYRPVAET